MAPDSPSMELSKSYDETSSQHLGKHPFFLQEAAALSPSHFIFPSLEVLPARGPRPAPTSRGSTAARLESHTLLFPGKNDVRVVSPSPTIQPPSPCAAQATLLHLAPCSWELA